MEHFWKHHLHNPFEPEKGNHMQIMICDRCGFVHESPYGTNPNEYQHNPCPGAKPKPKLVKVARQRDRTPGKVDYPKKKTKKL
jgi:hypothetical protein